MGSTGALADLGAEERQFHAHQLPNLIEKVTQFESRSHGSAHLPDQQSNKACDRHRDSRLDVALKRREFVLCSCSRLGQARSETFCVSLLDFIAQPGEIQGGNRIDAAADRVFGASNRRPRFPGGIVVISLGRRRPVVCQSRRVTTGSRRRAQAYDRATRRKVR